MTGKGVNFGFQPGPCMMYVSVRIPTSTTKTTQM